MRIKTYFGTNIDLHTDVFDLVSDAKQLIFAIEGIPRENQILMFKNLVLEDDKVFAEYKMNKKDEHIDVFLQFSPESNVIYIHNIYVYITSFFLLRRCEQQHTSFREDDFWEDHKDKHITDRNYWKHQRAYC